MSIKKLLSILGPGLLYAGAAIGVSHLVQSTRAGADYYFDLVWVAIAANIIKYPFFEFAPRYATATGQSLIHGYSQIGKWAVGLYAILTLLSMFAIQAAVTIVTAGIAGNIFHINLNPVMISAIILGATTIFLILGHYKALDGLMKVVILVLTVSTIVAVVSAFSKTAAHAEGMHFDWTRRADILFLIAFVGWMPAPIDVSVWSSLWTLAKQRGHRSKINLKDSLLDFKIGYIGTAFIALAFLALGAKVMYGSGESLSENGVAFSNQLIGMYTKSIGEWAFWFIALASLTTMFSTTLTCIDAFPRVLQPLTTEFFPKTQKSFRNPRTIYWIWLVIVVSGTLVTLGFLAKSMRFMVDMATTLSFVTAPVLAILNYKAVTHKQMPEEARPGKGLKYYAIVGIVFLSAFTVFYIAWHFFGI
jgi:Mn2+/Fe2+ NRAMP family transporter